MRWFGVLVAAMLAGCATPSSTGDPEFALGCTLTYPDGSPVSCAESRFSDVAVLDPPPGPQTGWTCKDHNEADTGAAQQIWMNTDGRLGVAWDFTTAPLEEPAIVFVIAYQDDQDQMVLVPFQPRGFVEFPSPPTASPVEIHVLAYHFELYANAVDPFQPEHWKPAGGEATFLASDYGADPWVAWSYTANGTTRQFDVMVPDYSEAGKPIFRPRGGLIEGETELPALYSIVSGGGTKWTARDPLQLRVNPGFCYVEDLPVSQASASIGP